MRRSQRVFEPTTLPLCATFEDAGLVGAMARVSIDQFMIGTPLFNTVFFYSTGRFAQGMTHDQAVQNVRDRLGSMLKMHWSFCK